MAKNDKKLTAAQRRAIPALLANRNVRAAAEAAGVGERTLHRWLEDADFIRELRRAEGELIDQAVRRLIRLQEGALEVVTRVMDDPDVAPSVRLRAAGMVLDQLVKLRELRDLEHRLAAVETILAEMGVRL